jgi:hypothetical protein
MPSPSGPAVTVLSPPPPMPHDHPAQKGGGGGPSYTGQDKASANTLSTIGVCQTLHVCSAIKAARCCCWQPDVGGVTLVMAATSGLCVFSPQLELTSFYLREKMVNGLLGCKQLPVEGGAVCLRHRQPAGKETQQLPMPLHFLLKDNSNSDALVAKAKGTSGKGFANSSGKSGFGSCEGGVMTILPREQFWQILAFQQICKKGNGISNFWQKTAIKIHNAQNRCRFLTVCGCCAVG